MWIIIVFNKCLLTGWFRLSYNVSIVSKRKIVCEHLIHYERKGQKNVVIRNLFNTEATLEACGLQFNIEATLVLLSLYARLVSMDIAGAAVASSHFVVYDTMRMQLTKTPLTSPPYPLPKRGARIMAARIICSFPAVIGAYFQAGGSSMINARGQWSRHLNGHCSLLWMDAFRRCSASARGDAMPRSANPLLLPLQLPGLLCPGTIFCHSKHCLNGQQ